MLYEIADNYFQSMSPLAERISYDISNIKTSYETLWHQLSWSEQENIINDAIIFPQLLKEQSIPSKLPKNSTCSFSCGGKLLFDDQTGSTWRDEHSAPFSWKSRSLLGLCESSKCIPALPYNDVSHNRKFSSSSGTAVSVPTRTIPSTSSTPFANLCNKLKLLPGKGFIAAFDDKNLLSKMATGAVEKLHHTIKIMTGKPIAPCNSGENDLLVAEAKSVIVARAESSGDCGDSSALSPPSIPSQILLTRGNLNQDYSAISSPMSGASRVVAVFPENDIQENFIPKSEGDIDSRSITSIAKTGFDFLDNW